MIILRTFLLIMALWSVSLTSIAAPKTILVVGDSLSAAYGIEMQQGWVALLQEQLKDNYHVVNASISGDTTANGLARLPKALDTYQPQIVLIELGGNDGLRGLPLNTIRNNLDGMIQQVKSRGAEPVLLGVRLPPNYGPTYINGFSQIYQDLAKKENIPVVPLFLQGIDEDTTLMQPDRIHPLAKAQPQMLQTVLHVLQPVLTQSKNS